MAEQPPHDTERIPTTAGSGDSPEPAGADGGGDAAAPDAASIAALQAANDELRRRNEELEGAGAGRTTNRWRTLLVVVLVAISALCATLMVPAIWGRNLVLNTDRYVETLAPLASEQGVQDAIVKAVNSQFADKVDISSLAKDVLPPAAAPLAGPLQAAAESLVNTVITRFVQSDAFQTLWEDANRLAHEQLVAVLTGNDSNGDAVSITDDKVVLNLAPIIDQVKQQLVDAGLSFASNVPSVGVTFTIAEVHGVDAARTYVRLLNRLAVWLPVLAILFLVGAIIAAQDRRKTIMAAMLSYAGGMLVLGLGIAIGRTVYLNSLPLTYLTEQSAGQVYDTLVRYLRLGLRIILLSALLVALIAWLAGPGTAPRRLRAGSVSLWRRLRAAPATGTVVAAARAHQPVVYGGIAALGAIVLVLWTNPSSTVVISIAIIVLVLIGLAALLLGAGPTRRLATAGAPAADAGERTASPESAPDSEPKA